MPQDLKLEFTAAGKQAAVLGESPFWDHGDFVWWVDITGKRLLCTRLSTRATQSWPTPETPGFVVLSAPDGPMVGMESGIFSFSPTQGRFERKLAFDAMGQRFNDATVDDTGRLWVTTMAKDGKRGFGALHEVTDDLALNTVMDGLSTPNGLAADMGTGRLFLSDSHPQVQTIWTARCDFRSGEVGSRTRFASTQRLAGRPDGAACAMAGQYYWVAGVDGGALYGYSREGVLAFIVPLPVPAPTKPALLKGGLFVTAKAEGGHDGRPVIATEVPAALRGSAITFWRAGGHTTMVQ